MTTKKRVERVHKNWSKDAKARGNRKITISAPDDAQNELYRQSLEMAIEGKEDPLVLVLGMTPEPRNLALSLGCRVLAADLNYDMMVNLQPSIEDSENPRNMVMRANWLDLDKYLQHGIFDIVIGDGVLAQLDPTGIKKLIANVFRMLPTGGYFSTRIDLYLPDYPVGKFEDYLAQYRKQELSLLELAVRTLMYSDFSSQLYERDQHLCHTHKFWELMEEKEKEGVITKDENKYMQERKMNLTHYFLPKPELYVDYLGPYFEEVEVEQFDELWPTYVGRKRNGE